MNKGIWAIIVIAVLAVVGILIYSLSSHGMNSSLSSQTPASSSGNQQTTAPSGQNPSSGQNSNPGPPVTHSIKISNFQFTPSALTINVGDTVIWANDDSVPHTVTSDSGSELSSSTLSPGQSYSHTFTTAGTYGYHCSIHTMMKGTITVQ